MRRFAKRCLGGSILIRQPATLIHVLLTQDVTTAFAMFDTDESGFIDKEEFEKMFATLRASRPGLKFTGPRTGFHPGPACVCLHPPHSMSSRVTIFASLRHCLHEASACMCRVS